MRTTMAPRSNNMSDGWPSRWVMNAVNSTAFKRALLIAPLPLLLALLYGLPLAGVIGWSVTLPTPGLEQYRQGVTDPSIRDMLLRTLRLCLSSTVVAVAIGYLLSYCWVFASRPWQRVVEIAVFVPMWISVLVRAFGWLIALGNEGILNTLLMSVGLIHGPAQLLGRAGAADAARTAWCLSDRVRVLPWLFHHTGHSWRRTDHHDCRICLSADVPDQQLGSRCSVERRAAGVYRADGRTPDVGEPRQQTGPLKWMPNIPVI